MTRFAQVVIPSPLKQALTYAVPPDLGDRLMVGMRVLIPLGKRKVIGIVFELTDNTVVANTKPILALLDDRPIFDSQLIRLSQWIAQYYLATIGEVVGAVLPPSLRSEAQRTVIAKPGASSSHPLERRILALLGQKRGRASLKMIIREFSDGAYHALSRLESTGAVEIHEKSPVRRNEAGENGSASDTAVAFQAPVFLGEEQERAVRDVDNQLRQGGFKTFLLHGITGSGKTEVYLRAMERVRDAGRRSLILIPEISLTPQLLDRLIARFPRRVGILHSRLTRSERSAHWWRIIRGDVDVVVGARSAVFAPVPDLGLIVVDEEHDPSYKQEEGLRYNGRDVAVVRGKLYDVPVILGSATPAIESYENCLQGRYRLLEMSKRVHERPLPAIEIVDLKSAHEEPSISSNGQAEKYRPDDLPANATGCGKLISLRLAAALKENYQKSRQSLIFLNRRGFANFLQCKLCGHVLRCQYCSVTLTLHQKQKNLSCHHCGFHRRVSEICPECDAPSLSAIGAGTEQIEETLQRLLPGARIARMDRDTTTQRGAQERLIRRWERGELDILIGTQMITKGHDVSGVTLVGALLADLSLNLPDFRAAERTFQLLSQVAGRAGRGAEPGRVIVQTYEPDHYVIQHLIQHDYRGFVRSEIDFRRALNYPPFSRLISLRVDGPKSDHVENKAKAIAAALRENKMTQLSSRDPIEILGPAPAPLLRLRNRYRWQILLKGKPISRLLQLAGQARETLPRSRNLRLNIDVDPYSML